MVLLSGLRAEATSIKRLILSIRQAQRHCLLSTMKWMADLQSCSRPRWPHGTACFDVIGKWVNIASLACLTLLHNPCVWVIIMPKTPSVIRAWHPLLVDARSAIWRVRDKCSSNFINLLRIDEVRSNAKVAEERAVYARKLLGSMTVIGPLASSHEGIRRCGRAIMSIPAMAAALVSPCLVVCDHPGSGKSWAMTGKETASDGRDSSTLVIAWLLKPSAFI